MCNAGSSSLKFSLFEAAGELLLAEGGLDWTRKPTRLVFRRTGRQEIREELTLEKHADAVVRILADLHAGPSAPLRAFDELQAAAHRLVHGGERYTSAVRVTPEVKRVFAELAELAPLHNPVSLTGIEEETYQRENSKRVYYLSTEFLIGCSLANNMTNFLLDPIVNDVVQRNNLHELQAEFGTPRYTRIDTPATPEQKARLEKLSPEGVATDRLVGEPIRGKLTRAPGDGAPIGGLKVVTDNGGFAARPSGTENIYKIYAESFIDQAHLDAIVSEAQEIVNDALTSFDSAHRQREVHS